MGVKMVRMLLKSLLSLSLIAPLSAFALGLGDVHLQSALGERLQANIDLLSVNQAEAENISVSLASQETFDKVGLDRPPFLMFLKFEVVQGAAGSYSIMVTSREPVNEPFLDFLVEVDWKSGRVLREYTLLLDPPSSFRETAPALSAPATVTSRTITPTASPATSPTAPNGPGTAPAISAQGGEGVTADPATAPAAALAHSRTPAGGIVYGPVKANETLWSIAERLRPSSDISVQQMMLALLKANPYAFFDNNINRLKRGYVLRIDDPSLLNALSKGEASREVARQTRVWQDYRESVASHAKQRPAAASTTVEAAPGAAAATARGEPKLKLVAPEGKGVDSATPSGVTEGRSSEKVSEELMLAMESSAAQRKENDALKSRLEALESQLQDMEKIITLKDADLATLQQQLREQGKAGETVSPAPAAQAGTTDLVIKPEESLPAAPQTPLTDTVETAPAADEVVKPDPVPQAAPAAVAEPKPSEVKKPAPKPKPKKVAPVPVEEPDLLESLLADPMMLGIGGGVVLFILILAGLIIKRRRKGGFQESILRGGTSSMMKANDEQGSETSFLSDLAISGMGPGTMHTDEGEVDPLTEADVFMAYGRNQQAEEVLKKAREKQPKRADIAAKLLTVYYSSKDSAKFEALAEEAVGILQGDDVLWGEVLAMGHELCPQNVLFKAGVSAKLPPVPDVHKAGSGDAVMDIGLDMDELTAEMEGEGGSGMDFDLGLDFSDLDEESGKVGGDDVALDSAKGFEETESALDETADASDLDMDLGALDLAVEADAAPSGGDHEEMDFAFDLGELSTEEELTSIPEDTLDLDMGDFDLDSVVADLGDTTAAADDQGLDLSLDDFGDLGDLDALGDLDDLGELEGGDDEMTTKLDLAQAYAEMGDAEGARSMLEEVVAGGSAEQQQQARALIAKL